MSLGFQGCQCPFLARLWTGGRRTRRLQSIWQLIGHIHQHYQIEPEDGCECLPPTDRPVGMHFMSTALCLCESSFAIRKAHFLHLHNLKSRPGCICFSVCSERFSWWWRAVGLLNSVEVQNYSVRNTSAAEQYDASRNKIIFHKFFKTYKENIIRKALLLFCYYVLLRYSWLAYDYYVFSWYVIECNS